MKKWLAASFICVYLGALTIGVAAYTFKVGISAHPAMYFIVWDMFCGWSAHSTEVQIIAEGESGDYYQLTPAPWGDFVPFATRPRQDYDPQNMLGGKMGANILQHTSHEPMVRILVVEKAWPKKFNIPDHVWAQAYAEPKDIHYYYRVRAEVAPDGTTTGVRNSWIDSQVARVMTENPRLRNDARTSDSPYVVSQPSPTGGNSVPLPFQLSPNAQ